MALCYHGGHYPIILRISEIPIPTNPKSAKSRTNGLPVMKVTIVVIHVTELVTIVLISASNADIVTVSMLLLSCLRAEPVKALKAELV